jgi:rSAM/selenodomain-associated transferase 1
MMLEDKIDHKKNLLIVFVKNLIAGKVKSRLALTIGYNSALFIYQDLMQQIHEVVADLPFEKQVAYATSIEKDDIWPSETFDKVEQQGKDIGDRMYNAISKGLESGYENVILIGSDIINLKSEIIFDAFNKLKQSEMVIGPAKDGGYYLIGLKKPIVELFEKKDWSTNKVLNQTLNNCIEMGLTVSMLPELADLDRIEDFQYLKPEDRKKYLSIIEKDASKPTHPYSFQNIKKGA